MGLRPPLLLAVFVVPSLAIAQAPPPCVAYDRWSLAAGGAQADEAFARLFAIPSCAPASGGSPCEAVYRQAVIADDHVSRVFEECADSRRNCLRGSLREVLLAGAEVTLIGRMLEKKGYPNAASLVNTHTDIVSWAGTPYCDKATPPTPSAPTPSAPTPSTPTVAVAAPGACDLAGTWTNQTNVTTLWTFTATAPGSATYQAKESGGCGASGTAILSGRSIKLDWSCPRDYSGTYSWDLDATCARGTGSVTHSGATLRGKKFNSTLSRSK